MKESDIDETHRDMLLLLEDEDAKEFLDLKALDSDAPGNTIRDRLQMLVYDGILGDLMKKYRVNDQLDRHRVNLQRQGVEIYTRFFNDPPKMNRPLLVCLKCLLIWSPVFDPTQPIPVDVGRCPNGCNEHIYDEMNH